MSIRSWCWRTALLSASVMTTTDVRRRRTSAGVRSPRLQLALFTRSRCWRTDLWSASVLTNTDKHRRQTQQEGVGSVGRCPALPVGASLGQREPRFAYDARNFIHPSEGDGVVIRGSTIARKADSLERMEAEQAPHHSRPHPQRLDPVGRHDQIGSRQQPAPPPQTLVGSFQPEPPFAQDRPHHSARHADQKQRQGRDQGAQDLCVDPQPREPCGSNAAIARCALPNNPGTCQTRSR